MAKTALRPTLINQQIVDFVMTGLDRRNGLRNKVIQSQSSQINFYRQCR